MDSESDSEDADDNISVDVAVLVPALATLLRLVLVRFRFLYGRLGFWFGLHTLSFHHRSMASSGQNSLSGTCALVIVNRSSSDSLESKDLFLVLMTLT